MDTTGAGDGFVAGLLAGLGERGGLSAMGQEELDRIGVFASAVGALTCLEKGAIPALPPRTRVSGFLDEQHRLVGRI